ncbi:uncharacterized protein TEOVI_000464400 [Trypanosoma equiperdum]|uniref:Uncharacterized protein n=1 Tax=Trypanosoma equiperdum TaxID=5694 RepID=A0A1G4IKR8_TRYEQ|nr:hypothetical protein, conserved [Trypanosoma equiperdum]
MSCLHGGGTPLRVAFPSPCMAEFDRIRTSMDRVENLLNESMTLLCGYRSVRLAWGETNSVSGFNGGNSPSPTGTTSLKGFSATSGKSSRHRSTSSAVSGPKPKAGRPSNAAFDIVDDRMDISLTALRNRIRAELNDYCRFGLAACCHKPG